MRRNDAHRDLNAEWCELENTTPGKQASIKVFCTLIGLLHYNLRVASAALPTWNQRSISGRAVTQWLSLSLFVIGRRSFPNTRFE